jgi:hypothetical protein
MTAQIAKTRRADCRDLLHGWLRHGPLHALPARQAAKRCGVLGQTGAQAYLYPEIAGYYLHWLSRQPGGHGQLARPVLQWLGDWANAPAPPARIALTRAGEDWRAAGLFAFDLAMLRRGCARWPALAEAGRLIDALDRLLDRLIEDSGRLDAVRAAGLMPVRWSTGPGAYQAKVAVALLESHVTYALPPRMAAATQRLVDEVRVMPSHREYHPELYAIEGLLVLDRPQAARRLANLLERVGADDWLREHADGGRRRTDVQAQAVRAARWLGLEDERTARMARALAAAIRADGSLPFDPDEREAPANTWCALFAVEALAASPDTDHPGMPT